MGAMASQITSLTMVYSAVYSGADQRKHQSSASLAFVGGIHRWPLCSPHKGPVTRNMFPFDDVIMSVRPGVKCPWRLNFDMQCCRESCQISKPLENYWSRAFETLRDFPIRRLMGYWIGAQFPHISHERLHTSDSQFQQLFSQLNELNLPDSNTTICKFIWIHVYPSLDIYLFSSCIYLLSTYLT